jgi:hypothetical protein
MTIENSKLAFAKTTLRSLTDEEINDVSGGTVFSPGLAIEMAIAAAMAAARAAEYAREMYLKYA